MALPTDAQERKNAPIYSGVLQYFPDAIVAVAQLSKKGNDQHNPGQPLHWAREKSADHHDCLIRHVMEAGTIDTDGVRHSAKVAWRALAALQLELEEAQVVQDKTDDDGWIVADPNSRPKVMYDCRWSDGEIWPNQLPEDSDVAWRRYCTDNPGGWDTITHWRPSKEF